MIKHVDAQDNDTGHSILLLKKGGQGEEGELELLLVKHLVKNCCQDSCSKRLENNTEESTPGQFHIQQVVFKNVFFIESSAWMREILSNASLTTFHCSPRPPLSRSFLLCFGNSL